MTVLNFHFVVSTSRELGTFSSALEELGASREEILSVSKEEILRLMMLWILVMTIVGMMNVAFATTISTHRYSFLYW